MAMKRSKNKIFDVFLPDFETLSVAAKDEVEAREMLKNILDVEKISDQVVFSERYTRSSGLSPSQVLMQGV